MRYFYLTTRLLKEVCLEYCNHFYVYDAIYQKARHFFRDFFTARKVKYDLVFKLKCVKEVQKKNHSIHLVSSRENFCKSLLRKWILD